jgi:hypothetical protein
MTVRLATSVRNAGLDTITAGIGSNGLLRIYDGTQPTNPGTALSGNTLLAELALSSTAAAGASGGVLTFSTITADSSANATGTQTWATLTTSGGTRIVDMSCGNGSGDLSLSGTITLGGSVSVTSLTITDGNA